MRLDEGHDDVVALDAEAPALLEHGVGLADAGGGAEEHPKPPPSHRLLLAEFCEGEIQLQHVHGGFAQVPEVPCLNPRLHEFAHLGFLEAPRLAIRAPPAAARTRG